MSIDLIPLATVHRLLFEIPLVPVQGHRFQPTGFPSLGAATFQTAKGTSLLVESAQSMANRLEITCWDESRQDLKADLAGLSHVRITRNGGFLTDSILESHRINSPYLLKNSDKSFYDKLKSELNLKETGPIDRHKLSEALLKFDIGSLLHGVFLVNIDGRLRVTRSLSAFVEADGVRIAASGGVKNDHVNPSGDTKTGFGNVPFARDEYTADRIILYVNLDLAQIRGYGLGKEVEHLMILLSLYKLRALVEGSLRFRTACDFKAAGLTIVATSPEGFELPKLTDVTEALKAAIATCADRMEVTEVSFNDEFKKGKDKKDEETASDADEAESED